MKYGLQWILNDVIYLTEYGNIYPTCSNKKLSLRELTEDSFISKPDYFSVSNVEVSRGAYNQILKFVRR